MISFFVFSTKAAEESYVAVQGRLNTLASKIKAKEDVIAHLFAQKEHTKNNAEIKEIVSTLTLEHRELKALINEYSKERQLIKYRFPELSDASERKYQRIDSKSLDQMEKEMGLNQVLNKAKTRVEKQYGVEKKEKDKPQDETQKQVPATEEEMQETLQLIK